MNFKAHRPEIIILAAALALRLAFAFSLPLYPDSNPFPGYNDEPMHLKYVSYLASVNKWPVWTASESAANPLIDEYPQPPLYYAIAAPIYQRFENTHADWGLFGARLVSIFFGMTGLFFVRWSAGLLTGSRIVSNAALTALAFSPNPVIFSSLVSNDPALFCFSAMAFHSLLLTTKGVGGASRQVWAGLQLAAAIWSKMSALALAPLALLAGRRETGSGRWMAAWRIAIVAVAASAPLFIWNVIQYGEMVPFVSIYTPEKSLGGLHGGGVSHPIMALKYFLRTAAQPLEVWGGALEKVTTVIWLVGALSAMIIGAIQLKNNASRLLLLSGIFFPFIAMIYYNIDFFQAEFRLMAPAGLPLAILCAAGISRFKIPLPVQAVFWALPLTSILFSR